MQPKDHLLIETVLVNFVYVSVLKKILYV